MAFDDSRSSGPDFLQGDDMKILTVSRWTLCGTTAMALALQLSPAARAQEGVFVQGVNENVTVDNNSDVTSPGLVFVDEDFGDKTIAGVAGVLQVDDGNAYTATVVQVGDVTLSGDGDLFGVGAIANVGGEDGDGTSTTTGNGTTTDGSGTTATGPGRMTASGTASASLTATGDITLTHNDANAFGAASATLVEATDTATLAVTGNTSVRSTSDSASGHTGVSTRGDARVTVNGDTYVEGATTLDGGDNDDEDIGIAAGAGSVFNRDLEDPFFNSDQLGGDATAVVNGDITVVTNRDEGAIGAVAVSDKTASLSVTGDTSIRGQRGFGLIAAGTERATVTVKGDVDLDVDAGTDATDYLPTALLGLGSADNVVDVAVGAGSRSGLASVVLDGSTITTDIENGVAVGTISLEDKASVTGSATITSVGSAIDVQSATGSTVDLTGSVSTTGEGNAIEAVVDREGDATIRVSGTASDSVRTTGEGAIGLYAETNDAGTVLIENAVAIMTEDDFADGIQAFATARAFASTTTGVEGGEPVVQPVVQGNITIRNTGAITTRGIRAEGIGAYGVTGTVIVENDADIITGGGDGIEAGVETINDVQGAGNVTITHKGDITIGSKPGDGRSGGEGIQGFVFALDDDGQEIGVGDVSITSEGTIDVTAGDGIGLFASTAVGTVSVNHTGDIAAAQRAIVAYARTSGDVTATMTGNASTTATDRISIEVQTGDGDATVTLDGTVTSGHHGIVVDSDMGDATATLILNGASTAAGNGVDVEAANGLASAILNGAGSLTATGGDAILVRGDAASATVDVAAGSTLASDANALSVLATDGAATVAVTNAGTIEGETLVEAGSGTVSVTNSGTITGIVTMADGSTADTVTNDGTITGNVETGAGVDTVTLASGSSLTGSIDLGAGNDIATVAGGTFTGTLDGGADTDALTLTDGGAVSLARIVNFESTSLTGGRFAASGVGSGPVSVRSGATLAVASAATAGAVTNEGRVAVADGATLSAASYTARGGSTTGIGLSSTTSGTIAATGAVALESGSALALTVAPDADISEGRTFTLATGSSVTDASTLTDDSALYRFTKSVNGANTLVVTSERDLVFADNAPGDPELRNVGASLDTAIERDTALRAQIDTAIQNGATEDEVLADLAPADNFAELGAVKAAGIRRAGVIFDRITGRLSSGSLAGSGGVAFAPVSDTSVFSTSAASSPVFAASMDATGVRSRGAGLWVKGYVGTADQDGTPTSGGFDADNYGVAVGADYRIAPGIVVGVAGSYGSTDIDLNGASSGDTVDATSLTGILYGGVENGPMLIEGQVFYGMNEYDGSSLVLGNRLTGDYDGTEYGAGMRASYTFDAGEGVAAAPEIGLTYTRLSTDAYSERGVGARSYRDADFDSLLGYAGVRVSTDYHSGSTRITPQLRIGLEHEFEGDFEQVASFTAGGVPFTITNDDRENTRFRLGGGIEVAMTNGISLGLDYDGAFGSDYQEHGGSLRMRIDF